MGEAIGQMLPFAVGIAISPIPIVAIVLMLGTQNAKSSGLDRRDGGGGSLIIGVKLIGDAISGFSVEAARTP